MPERNPEVDEIDTEDLQAAADMMDGLAAGTWYAEHEAACRWLRKQSRGKCRLDVPCR
jgi:hypothetical protein